MPDGFEYVIRPYQSPGSLANTVIPSTPRGTRERAHLVWGGKGTMPQTKTLYPNVVVNTKKEDLFEQDRDSEVKRIVGNDGESYVDVARAKTVRLNKEETSTPNIAQNFYAAGPTVSQALVDYYSSFSAVNNAVATSISKTTWNMKNE